MYLTSLNPSCASFLKHKKPSKKKNFPLYIALGTIGAVGVGAAIFFTSRSKVSFQKEDNSRTTSDEPSASSPPPPLKPFAAVSDLKKQAVDSLHKLKDTSDYDNKATLCSALIAYDPTAHEISSQACLFVSNTLGNDASTLSSFKEDSSPHEFALLLTTLIENAHTKDQVVASCFKDSQIVTFILKYNFSPEDIESILSPLVKEAKVEFIHYLLEQLGTANVTLSLKTASIIVKTLPPAKLTALIEKLSKAPFTFYAQVLHHLKEQCDSKHLNLLSKKIELCLNEKKNLDPQALSLLCYQARLCPEIQRQAFQALAKSCNDQTANHPFVALCRDKNFLKELPDDWIEEFQISGYTMQTTAAYFASVQKGKNFTHSLNLFLTPFFALLYDEPQNFCYKILLDGVFQLIKENKGVKGKEILLKNFPSFLQNFPLLLYYFHSNPQEVISRLKKYERELPETQAIAYQCLACLTNDPEEKKKYIKNFKEKIDQLDSNQKYLNQYFPYALVYGGDSIQENSAHFLIDTFLKNCKLKSFDDSSFLQVLEAYEGFSSFHYKLLDFYLEYLEKELLKEEVKTNPKSLFTPLHKMTALYSKCIHHTAHSEEQKTLLKKYQPILSRFLQHGNIQLTREVLKCLHTIV